MTTIKIAGLPNGVLLTNSEGLTDDNSTIGVSISNLYSLVNNFDKVFNAGQAVREMKAKKESAAQLAPSSAAKAVSSVTDSTIRIADIYEFVKTDTIYSVDTKKRPADKVPGSHRYSALPTDLTISQTVLLWTE